MDLQSHDNRWLFMYLCLSSVIKSKNDFWLSSGESRNLLVPSPCDYSKIQSIITTHYSVCVYYVKLYFPCFTRSRCDIHCHKKKKKEFLRGNCLLWIMELICMQFSNICLMIILYQRLISVSSVRLMSFIKVLQAQYTIHTAVS